MNDADTQKVKAAIKPHVNMEAHLNNMLGRGPRAVKSWANSAKAGAGLNPAGQKKLREGAALVAALLKEAKVVLKELDGRRKDVLDKKLIASQPNAKLFRDKVIAQRLVALKKFEANASRAVLLITTSMGDPALWPGMSEPDTKVTVDSLKEYTNYFNQMRVGLAKL